MAESAGSAVLVGNLGVALEGRVRIRWTPELCELFESSIQVILARGVC